MNPATPSRPELIVTTTPSSPSRGPSWRPSVPLPRTVGVYRAKKSISYLALYSLFAFFVLFAVAFTVYLLLTQARPEWPPDWTKGPAWPAR
ncbi:MAG: hypothetical protein HYV09_30075 [Deltaproteobacteria bacterium]|nr:hypothetical protein [Deltaproteobacteria bacterium]